jgi:hypothetical protein
MSCEREIAVVVAERGALFARDRDIRAYSGPLSSRSLHFKISMPTVAISPRAAIKTTQSPLSSSGISHISSSQALQECRDESSLSPPRLTKRRPAIVMMECEDDGPSVDSKPTIHGQKRQKYENGHSNGIQDGAFSTSSRNVKSIRQLQEQREQLPIARGGYNPQVCIIMTYFLTPSPSFCQGASHSCAVSL